MIKSMGLGNIYGRMAEFMRDCGFRENSMEGEDWRVGEWNKNKMGWRRERVRGG